MMTILWAGVLLLAVWAAYWGAERLSDPLRKLRRQWGFSVAAGGSFLGLAAASPEIGINTTSAIRGVSDIGLGAMLGSNVIAIPIMVAVAYATTRNAPLDGGHGDHEAHQRERRVPVGPGAVTVQVLPYLAILAVFAVLTLPKPWRGLQPIDGWILLIAYLAYLAHALLRGRRTGEGVEWKRTEVWTAAAGVGAGGRGLLHGFLDREHRQGAGLPGIVGGLFITAPMAALPEAFATRSVVRSGQITSAATSVIGDHTVTMTLAFIPLTIVTTQIQDLRLFWVSLAFVALMPMLYAGFIHWGGREHGFRRWQVFAFAAAYLAFVAVVVFRVQPFGSGSSSQGG